MSIIYEIESYLEFLKTNYNLLVTLHPYGKEYLISNSSLFVHNIHISPYCLYLKTNPDIQTACIQKQKVLKSYLCKTSPFTGVCYAGVKERVYGLFLRGEFIGFVSVSGYKADKSVKDARINKICDEYKLSKQNVRSAYENLSDDFPDEAFLDTLITPLCRMIELGNMQLGQKFIENNNLYIKILGHINMNFCSNISISELGKKFSVSRSAISHTFKKLNGMSIRKYITFLRIEFAEKLLVCTSESVTDIALTIGFSDSAYFSNVFKKTTGVTPLEYRKKHA